MKILQNLFFILVLFAKSQQQDDFSKCKESLAQIFLPNQNYNNYSQYRKGSSLTPNHLGDYLFCMDQADTNFITVYYDMLIQNNIIRQQPIVLCVDKNCTSELLRQNKQEIQQSISSILQNQTIQIQNINFYDTVADAPQFEASSISTIAFICFFAFLSIFSSLFIYRLQQAKLKKQQTQATLTDSQSFVVAQSNFQSSAFNSSLGNNQQSIGNNLQSTNVNNNQQRQQQLKPLSEKIFECFSIEQNFKKLMNQRSSGETQFQFINGTRVLSIFWVVLGHEYSVRIGTQKNGQGFFDIVEQPGIITIVSGAYFAVDIFFYLSGFLAANIILQQFLKMKSIKVSNVLFMWFHRFLRIWPTYVIALLIFWQVMKYTGEGPQWFMYLDQVGICDDSIWKNILLLDNWLVSSAQYYCYPISWYLSNDFQFFLITPIIIWLYVKQPKLGNLLIFSLFSVSIFLSFYVAIVKNFVNPIISPTFKFESQVDFYCQYYFKPYIRITPYLLGIINGIFYTEYKQNSAFHVKIVNQVKNSRATKIILYILGLFLINLIIWCVVPIQKDTNNWTQAEHVLYLALAKVGFTLGFIFLTFPCTYGVNDLFNKILGAKFWIPLARISFCLYLIHYSIIQRSLFNQKMVRFFSNQYVFYNYIADLLISIVVATLISLIFESPILNIEKTFIIGNRVKAQTQEKEEIQQNLIQVKEQSLQ